MLLKPEMRKNFKKVLTIYEDIPQNDLYETLNLAEDKAKILKLENDIAGTKFKIAIIGEFSTGKSTLINSLIQKDILPAKFRPTTNQITLIKDNNKKEYVRIINQPDTEIPLTKDNVSKLDTSSQKNIEIGVTLPNLANYEIYDTPGVNDPSMFSDEIVFDLIGKVDVVIFTMHATQVLKQSEIDFLTKLIREKDVDKFFFVINQVDIIGDEQYVVKEEFLEKLSRLLHTSKDKLANKTFLYSAKKCLEAIKQTDDSLLQQYGYNAFINGIDEYIKTNKKTLFQEIVNRELNLIIQDTSLKINTVLDQLDNKDKEYENTLREIEQQIHDFQIEIEDAIYDFTKDFNHQKTLLQKGIETNFEAIKQSVVGEISTLPIEKISEGRYIEIRTKKLIEDATNKQFNLFNKNLQTNLEKLDTQIKPIYDETNIVINDLVNKNYASTIVTGVALGGAAIGAVVYAPTILGVGISAIVTSSIAGAFGGAIGGIGGAIGGSISTAIGTATSLAIEASKVVFSLAQWGVKGIGSFSNKVENIAKIKNYQKGVSNSIDEIKNTIMQNINENLYANLYVDLYIQAKFPQQNEIKRKIELSKNELTLQSKNTEALKAELLQLQNKLKGAL